MKIADSVEGTPKTTNESKVEEKKRPEKLNLSAGEIKDMVKIKRMEKSGGARPSLNIKEDKLKQALDDGTVDFSPRDRAVLDEILKP